MKTKHTKNFFLLVFVNFLITLTYQVWHLIPSVNFGFSRKEQIRNTVI